MERKVATYDEGTVFYLGRDGSDDGAPTLLMLHGLCGSAEVFDTAEAAEPLAGSTLAAIDLPGFGATPDVDDPTLDVMSDAVLGVLDREDPDQPPWVVAHGIAASVAARVLDDIAGLVLIEGALLPAHLGLAAEIAAMDEDAFADHFAGMQQAAGELIARDTSITDATRLSQYGEAYRQCARQTVRSVASLAAQDVKSGDVLQRLKGSDKPVLLLWGADSGYGDSAAELADALPDAATAEIAGARSYPMLDNPDATWAAVAARIG